MCKDSAVEWYNSMELCLGCPKILVRQDRVESRYQRLSHIVVQLLVSHRAKAAVNGRLLESLEEFLGQRDEGK